MSYTSVSDSSKGLNQAGRINEAGALQESDQIRYGWPRNRTEIVQNKDGIAKVEESLKGDDKEAIESAVNELQEAAAALYQAAKECVSVS